MMVDPDDGDEQVAHRIAHDGGHRGQRVRTIMVTITAKTASEYAANRRRARGTAGPVPRLREQRREAFKRDIKDAKVTFFDTGHFALETHCDEIAASIGDFLAGIEVTAPRGDEALRGA
jgi:hypothetical protein